LNTENDPKVKIVKMTRSPFSRCPVDIIIPFYGQYDKVAKLLQSIILAVKSNPYQITIVDDGSPNATFVDEFKDFDKLRPPGTNSIVQVLRMPKRSGFGEACRFGYNNTQQPYVMIMQSDCVVEDPNWMIEMGRSLLALKDQGVKMIGAKTGCYSPGADPRIKSAKTEKTEDYILGAEGFLPLHCVLSHRELYPKIQGFIKSYSYPSYEDEELAHRMRHFGYKQAICGRAWVHHENGGTIGPMLKENPEIFDEMEKNRDRCIADLQSLYAKK